MKAYLETTLKPLNFSIIVFLKKFCRMKPHLKVVLLFSLIITFGACKEKSKREQVPTKVVEKAVTKSIEDPYFFITLEALFEKDDQIQFFYLQDQSESYSPNQMILKEVKGSDTYQEVVIALPKESYPYNFRLDLSTNYEQTSVKVKRCVLNYGDRKFVINGENIQDYFTFNQGIAVGSDSQTFKLKTFKESGKDKYDPFMVGNLKLNEVLLKNL